MRGHHRHLLGNAGGVLTRAEKPGGLERLVNISSGGLAFSTLKTFRPAPPFTSEFLWADIISMSMAAWSGAIEPIIVSKLAYASTTSIGIQSTDDRSVVPYRTLSLEGAG